MAKTINSRIKAALISVAEHAKDSKLQLQALEHLVEFYSPKKVPKLKPQVDPEADRLLGIKQEKTQ